MADQILPSDASSANFFCSYFWALAESNTVSASSFAVGRCNAVNSCWRRRCVLEAADQFFTLPNENTLPANNFSCLVAHVVPRVQVGFVASPTGNHFSKGLLCLLYSVQQTRPMPVTKLAGRPGSLVNLKGLVSQRSICFSTGPRGDHVAQNMFELRAQLVRPYSEGFSRCPNRASKRVG